MSTRPSRVIFAENLGRLIDADTPGGKRNVRAWATARNLDVRLIDRLSKGQHAVTLDKLEEIAAACNLQPWHLLVEDMDPSKEQPEAPITDAERAMLRRLRKLLGDGPPV